MRITARSPQRWGPCIKPWCLWISNATNGPWKLINSLPKGAVLMNREQGSCNHTVQTWGTFCPESKWCWIPAPNYKGKEKIKLGFIIINMLLFCHLERNNSTLHSWRLWIRSHCPLREGSVWEVQLVWILIHCFHLLEKWQRWRYGVTVSMRACTC